MKSERFPFRHLHSEEEAKIVWRYVVLDGPYINLWEKAPMRQLRVDDIFKLDGSSAVYQVTDNPQETGTGLWVTSKDYGIFVAGNLVRT